MVEVVIMAIAAVVVNTRLSILPCESVEKEASIYTKLIHDTQNVCADSADSLLLSRSGLIDPSPPTSEKG